jgi:hypothetical protein
LPPSAEVLAARRCLSAAQRFPGDGEWQVIDEQCATGVVLQDLMSALALPSEPRGDGACAAVFIGPSAVELETVAGAVTVALPVDGCGTHAGGSARHTRRWPG